LNNIDTITLLREGDPVVFKCVFDEYHERVYSYVYKKTNSSYIAEETLQLTFIKLWKYRSSLSDQLSLFTQVFRIASTTMIDLIRMEQKKQHWLNKLKDQQLPPEDAEHPAEENELQARIAVLVRQMPGMQKRVFEMSRFGDMSYREIAVALSISVKTVETHISRALKFLRQHLSLFVLLIF
jgi:RNA polymerase sigma-70 factor (ECF subfamily)